MAERQRGRQGERQRPDRPGRGEASDPVLDPSPRPRRRAGGARRSSASARHLDVGDDRRAVVQVVEHEQRVGHHHHGIGQIPVVGRRVGQRLDGPNDVVAQVAHRAAGEARQPRYVHRRVAAEQPAQVLERRHAGLDLPPAGGRRPARARAVAVAIDLARVGGEKGVAGPALAALERLEQEAVRAPVELGEGRDRRIAVEDNFPGHGHHRAALPGAGRERVEGRGHFAAATT